jgi:hypothetical protein
VKPAHGCWFNWDTAWSTSPFGRPSLDQCKNMCQNDHRASGRNCYWHSNMCMLCESDYSAGATHITNGDGGQFMYKRCTCTSAQYGVGADTWGTHRVCKPIDEIAVKVDEIWQCSTDDCMTGSDYFSVDVDALRSTLTAASHCVQNTQCELTVKYCYLQNGAWTEGFVGRIIVWDSQNARRCASATDCDYELGVPSMPHPAGYFTAQTTSCSTWR